MPPQRASRWLVPLLLAAVAFTATLAIAAARADRLVGGVHGFPLAAPRWSNAASVPRDLHVMRTGGGYDGQAFYRLALDPVTTVVVAHGIRLDTPAYRAQRVGYPVLAWLGSHLGAPVSMALLGVNMLATATTAGLGALLARTLHRPEWAGALLAATPGAVIAVSRDTGEAVELMFLVATMLALAHRRRGLVALALSAAVLTRETAVLLALPVAVTALWRDGRRRRWQPTVLGVAPLLVWSAWQIYLRLVWGRFPTQAGANNLGRPFHACVPALGDAVAAWVRHPGLNSSLLLPVLVIGAGMALITMRQSDAPMEVRGALLLATVMAVCLSHAVWAEPHAYLRACTEVAAFASVSLLGLRRHALSVTTTAAVGGISAVGAAAMALRVP